MNGQEEEREQRIHLTPNFEGSPEQNMSEQDESQEEAEASSDMIEYSENTVVTRLETKTLKGVPKEWQETIQVRHIHT